MSLGLGIGLEVAPPVTPVFVRPEDWLPQPTILPTENKIALLIPVYNFDSNWVVFTISGAYTVDWGDGTVENFAAGARAQRNYNYANTGITSPVRGDGSKLVYAIITPQAGQVFTSVNFNVLPIDATLGTFQNTSPILEIIYSAPSSTSAPSIGSMISGDVRLVNLTNFVGVNMGTGDQAAPFLFNNCISLENVDLQIVPNYTNLQFMFAGCSSLVSVSVFDTKNCTNMASMFASCSALPEIPCIDTGNCVSLNFFASGCRSIATIPLLDTKNCTEMQSMFNGCTSLLHVPLLNTQNVTNMNSMLSGCSSLRNVPLFNTQNVLNMAGMFSLCRALTSVPLFNTQNVTSMGVIFAGMFQDCSKLETVPLLNTQNVTSMASMFQGCTALDSVPLFNTQNVTDMSSMFSGCSRLTRVPQFDTSKVTGFSSMFNNCPSLIEVNFPVASAGVSVSKFSSIVSSCRRLSRVRLGGAEYSLSVASCNMSASELINTMNDLDNIASTSQTFTITGNFGAPTPVTITTTTNAGVNSIAVANTTGIQVGMQVTGNGTGLTTGRAVTFTDAGDLVTLNSHGLQNGDPVMFSAITSTTGIAINTRYFVVNATTNTFQVALTANGSPLALTTNGTGTVRYANIVTSIVPNTSVTFDKPMASPGTNTLAFRSLPTRIALLKGWAVTG